jgi:sulfur-oxidizing protein SoxZ
MADPMRIRAAMDRGKVDIKVLMAHEMETGQRKDAQGRIVPAHFIRNVTVTHAGRTVLAAQWGTSVSRNPFLHFRFTGGKPGEKVSITWVDNKGETRTDEATITG